LSTNVDTTDKVFRGIARGGGFVLLMMAMIGAFLAIQASPSLHKAGLSFFTTQDWNPDGGGSGILAVLTGTVLIALVAVAVALPLATGTALYISEYSPLWLRRARITAVDLMPAVPSVVYGSWGSSCSNGRRRAWPAGSLTGSAGSRSSGSTAPTGTMFSQPQDPRTYDYVNGRFG
jgi:phosphate transport system permease protein